MPSPTPRRSNLSMPDPRVITAAAGLALIGAVMVATRMTQWRDLGWLLILVGCIASGWWTSEALRVRRYRRDQEREEQRRAELHASRKKKEVEERSRRDAEKRIREEQTNRQREQRAEEGRRRKEAEEAAARERAGREADMEAEAARLRALPPDALREEVRAKLQTRGLRSEVEPGDPDGLLLSDDRGLRAVLRIVHQRTAGASDAEQIEAWRRDVAAPEAYLICVRGFAPNALRAAQGKPITLVESHLLATWAGETGSEASS